MTKTPAPFEDHIFKIGLAFAALIWIAESLIYAISRNGQGFLKVWILPDPMEALRRCLAVGVILGFSVMLQRVFRRHKQNNVTLGQREAQFRKILDSSCDAVLICDPTQETILDASPKACEMLGFTEAELRDKTLSEIYPNRMSEIRALIGSALKNGPVLTEKLNCQTKEATSIPVEVSVAAVVFEGKSCILVLVRDLSVIKREEAFHHLSITVFKNASEGILVADAAGTILSVNPAFSRVSGYSVKDLLGKNTRILKSGKQDKHFYIDMWNAIKNTDQWEGEIWNRRKNGEVYPNRLALTAVRNEQGEISKYIALYSDMTLNKQVEEKLHFQTHYDPLTGLPNRTLALERLSQAIKQIRRDHGRAALLLITLSRFKQVNDTFGHNGGDLILQQVAKRLASCLREVDTVARTGGDEFLVVLVNSIRRDGPSIVAQKIIKKMALAFVLEGQEVFLGSNIGITVVPEDGDEVLTLLQNADIAMTKAKREGSNRFCLFNGEMEKEAKSRALLEWDLRRALDNREFVVYYQPVIDLNTMETISLEALIRWDHPDKGLIPPGAFIPLAESSGLITEMGKWILKAACNQVQQWRNRNGYRGSINVNVSTRQMVFSDFRSVIVEALNESCLPPECLTLEVTESLMLDPKEDPIAKLQELKAFGVKLAIDDFGTGYSSLSYLWKYPIDYLKIDKSFIYKLESDKNKQHLVAAMVRMGQSMKMNVVAEGVETKDDLMWLIDLGCNSAQGYYFSKPIPAKNFESILMKTSGRPSIQSMSVSS